MRSLGNPPCNPYYDNWCLFIWATSKDSWPLDECQEHQYNAEEEVKHVEHRMVQDLVGQFGPLPCRMTFELIIVFSFPNIESGFLEFHMVKREEEEQWEEYCLCSYYCRLHGALLILLQNQHKECWVACTYIHPAHLPFGSVFVVLVEHVVTWFCKSVGEWKASYLLQSGSVYCFVFGGAFRLGVVFMFSWHSTSWACLCATVSLPLCAWTDCGSMTGNLHTVWVCVQASDHWYNAEEDHLTSGQLQRKPFAW